MNKRKQSSTRGRKRAARGITLCFIATIALTGAYTWTNYKERAVKELEVAEIEQEEILENPETEQASGTAQKAEEQVEAEQLPEAEPAEVPETQTEQSSGTEAAASNVVEASFSEGDLLLWPVDGNVLMSYSMDKTVYFATLDQYKYNPALIISGAENDNVIASAPGVVKSIDVLPQTGTTVTVDMGNGYECLYGQLKDVQVKTGDDVVAGTVIGYLSAPTKYYSVEGCNLYFEMRKDGQPVNPIDYVEQE